jgi:hypothetical protein
MHDSLDAKLEHVQRDFLITELEQHSWNINTVSKRYSIPKQKLLNAIGEEVLTIDHTTNTDKLVRSHRSNS